jgi:hypothetical protein
MTGSWNGSGWFLKSRFAGARRWQLPISQKASRKDTPALTGRMFAGYARGAVIFQPLRMFAESAKDPDAARKCRSKGRASMSLTGELISSGRVKTNPILKDGVFSFQL